MRIAILCTRLAVLWGLTVLVPSARAQTEETTSPDSALARTLRSIAGEPLGLETAIRQAMQQGTEALRAAAIVLEAEGRLRREKGEFDPELFADVERRSDASRTTSPFETVDRIDVDATTLSTGVRTTLRFGTELEAALEASRRETTASFATVNPQYDAEGTLRLRQPLLRGLGPGARLDLSAAEHNLEAATATRDQLLLRLRADVETAYWDLFAAWRDHAVRLLLAERAQSFVTEARTRASAGLVGPSQVASARVFAAEQQLAALDSEERLDAASDHLASFFGLRPRGAPRFRPVDEPPQDMTLADETEAVAQAMSRNASIRATERQLQALRATWRGLRWNALPDLDLTGSIGGTGLSGRGRDVSFGDNVIPSRISGDLGDSFEQVLGGDFPTWAVGLELSLPLGSRAGRGERDRVRAQLLQLEQQLEAERRTVEEDVRARAREVANGARRLVLAREGVAAAAEQVRVGLIEFRNGRSTAFELVRLAADYAASEQRLSASLVRTAKAVAALRQLTTDEVSLQ